MFCDTVTVYNYRAGQWFPTIITNAELQSENAAKENNSGASSSDGALLLVNISGNAVGGKEYVSPEAYARLSSPEGFVTFAPGDLFVVGGFSGIVNDDDYTDGFYSHLNEENSGCFKIISVKRFKLLPHFEIGGA